MQNRENVEDTWILEQMQCNDIQNIFLESRKTLINSQEYL